MDAGVRFGARARRLRLAQIIALACVVATVVATVVGCAAFVPLATHTFQRALLYSRVTELGALGRQISVGGDASVMRSLDPSAGQDEVTFEMLRGALDPSLVAVTTGEVHRRRAQATFPSLPDVVADIVSSTDACEHLRIVAGRCPASGEGIAMSQAIATFDRLQVGSSVTTGRGRTMRVAGIYADPDADPFWAGYALGPVRPVSQQGNVEFRQTWVAADDFVAKPWNELEVTRTLDTATLTPATLDAALAGTASTADRLSTVPGPPLLTENLRAVDRLVRADLEQIGVIVPLLVGQLILLLLVVLWLVTRAVVDQRRPELSLARLRGLGARGARALVVAELWPAYVVGGLLGLGLAYAADAAMRVLWLPGSLATAWSWPALVVAAATVLVAIGLLALLTTAQARRPLTELLRSVGARRAGARLGGAVLVMTALSIAGVIGVATGSLTGPFALVTPFLTALVLGILAGAVLAPAASRALRRRLDRGRLTSGLVLVQLARRPAARHVLLALTIATALVTFSSAAVAAADRTQARRSCLRRR